MLKLSFLNGYRDIGLLLLRVGIGVMFVVHGYPKVIGGPEKWEAVGGAMANLGITFAPTFWGLMAALSEMLGGILFALGCYMRLTCLFMTFTMIVAATSHFSKGETLSKASHAIEAGILFFSMIFIGAGKYSIDKE